MFRNTDMVANPDLPPDRYAVYFNKDGDPNHANFIELDNPMYEPL